MSFQCTCGEDRGRCWDCAEAQLAAAEKERDALAAEIVYYRQWIEGEEGGRILKHAPARAQAVAEVLEAVQEWWTDRVPADDHERALMKAADKLWPSENPLDPEDIENGYI